MTKTKAQSKRLKESLQKGRTRQSDLWLQYKQRKQQILSRRISSMRRQELIEREYKKTLSKVSGNWNRYRQTKFRIENRSQFPGLLYNKKEKLKSGRQEFYTVRNPGNLDNIMAKIFASSKVRYILVIMKLILPEGIEQTISDVFTKPAFMAARERGESVYNLVIEKLSFLQKYEGYSVKSVHLRVIYADVTKSKK